MNEIGSVTTVAPILGLSKQAFVIQGLKKIGRDLAIGGGLTTAYYMIGALALSRFGGGFTFVRFPFWVVSTVMTAAGITTGRYIGGGIGAVVDSAIRRTEQRRYRRVLATVAGSIGGLLAFLLSLVTGLLSVFYSSPK